MRENMMATINVSVTPTGKNGDEVECDITGREVIDDAIFLPKANTYVINFDLDPAAAENWNLQNPFCANNGKCPALNAAPHGHFTVQRVSNKQLTVEARPPAGKSVFHYRLNFSDGGTCDPIIIRD
jgi:hypothetical protein